MLARPALPIKKVPEVENLEEPDGQQPEPEPGPIASIIIVSYRRGAALRRCVAAIEKAEQRKRLDVIVLDLGMYDTTGEWDLEFPETTFLRLPRNFGATKALNIGIRSAKAALLCFLDPAVELLPDTIPRLVAALEEIPEAGAVCPLLVDEQGNAVPQVRRLPDKASLWQAWQDEAALTATVPPVSDKPVVLEYPGRKALVVPRSFLKGMNYFDEKYGEWGADLELAFQIRHAGKKALLIPDVKALDRSALENRPAYASAQRATLAADRLNGVSHFLSKRAGFVAGLMVLIQAILVTLLRALTFQDAGYNWSLLASLLGGQKIDGSQGGI
jgi:N-acetylglucosaminyl-diphospho-decaprenol L-rhamnosyltransferase